MSILSKKVSPWRVEGKRNVLTASRDRILKVYKDSAHITVAYSGGKDSIVLADIVYKLAVKGKMNPKNITFLFIDEEAIFPCVEHIVKEFREKVLRDGFNFVWYCLEWKHFSGINELESDESFICWDREKENVWVREVPEYAIVFHPLFKKGDTYQQFLGKLLKGSIVLIGLRVYESVQRLKMFRTKEKKDTKIYPIYDWKDSDVWKYIKDNKLDIPDAYLYMYKIGVLNRNLRISQFFSVDTMMNLARLMEYYPGLYEKIINREENAYLAMIYWDTEMFGRRTKTNKALMGEVDYKEETYKLLEIVKEKDYNKYMEIKTLIERTRGKQITPSAWRSLYRILKSGDPKHRIRRSFYATITATKANNQC